MESQNTASSPKPMIDLGQFRGGTSQYHKHWLRAVYTDGMKHIADECGAYWLIDLVVSHRNTLAKGPNRLVLSDFPVKVTLEKWVTEQKPNGAKVLVQHYTENGDPIVFTLQTVPYTDFPFERFENGKFTFLLGYDVESRMLILSLREED